MRAARVRELDSGALATTVLSACGADGLGFDREVVPWPRAGQVRVRAVCSLISPGTELHYIDQCARRGDTLRLGYCSAGHVDAVGDGVEGIAPGDRVIGMGWGYAVHSPVVCVPYRLCAVIPPGVAFADAVVANLAATAVHAVDRAELSPHDDAFVVGAGLVGQLVAQCASARARSVFVTDRHPERLRGVDALGVHPLRGDDAAAALAAAPSRANIRKVFLCITGDATAVFDQLTEALAPPAPTRAVIVCVGRFSARLEFSVAMGNLDIRYAARCGAGYRDDDHAHGRKTCAPPSGEGTVDRNLARALRCVARGIIRPGSMNIGDVAFEDALSTYERLRRRDALLTARLLYTAQAQS